MLKGETMKRAILGALLGAGLVAMAVGLCGQRNEVFAQHVAPSPATAAGGDLIAIPVGPVGERSQMLTVIDPRQRVMSVYHIDGGSGKIALLSVRNIQWDLQMMDFNGVNPLPREIRTQLEQR
jgi:hypothetical protein